MAIDKSKKKSSIKKHDDKALIVENKSKLSNLTIPKQVKRPITKVKTNRPNDIMGRAKRPHLIKIKEDSNLSKKLRIRKKDFEINDNPNFRIKTISKKSIRKIREKAQ